ncbi:NAD(P)H-dependent oxidoreductase, partial [Kibdelosporangium lantanae]
MLEERTGTVIALVVSSLVFGLVHIINVNATLWGAISIGLTGGLLTSSLYVVTRSLWFPLGLHFAWDFTHSGVFKSFFDVIEDTALVGKPVVIAATGGTARHSLVLEHALRPMFAYLRTIVAPTSVYVA